VQLQSLLDLDALTVTGRRLRDNLAGVAVNNPAVIRPLDRAFASHASIVVLRGSLAPESAIVRPGLQRPGDNGRFEGTALVYDDVQEAIGGVQKGELKPGHVLVLRGCGPKGGPAMAGSASRVVFAIYAAGLEDQVAFVSDGQLSGLCNKGMTIAEVSPEAAVGGPLALVERDDRIRIDLDARTLDLDVPAAEMEKRRVRRGHVPLPAATGYLSIYQRSVQPMSTGAVLVTPERR
jgi:dihydroxy-acid dehydratase